MSSDLGLTFSPELIDVLADRVVDGLAQRIAPPPEPFLDTDQAAEYLACKRRRIQDLAERGILPTYRDGRRLLFRREDLDAYVAGGG